MQHPGFVRRPRLITTRNCPTHTPAITNANNQIGTPTTLYVCEVTRAPIGARAKLRDAYSDPPTSVNPHHGSMHIGRKFPCHPTRALISRSSPLAVCFSSGVNR